MPVLCANSDDHTSIVKTGLKLIAIAGHWRRAIAPETGADAESAYTVEIPSIGLMSPTNRSRSAMVKSPGVWDGSVGFQSLPFSHR
jgi:hypothetical protein